MKKKPEISLGPLLYFWPKDTVLNFYNEIAKSPVDIVYLGETVCAKRTIMSYQDWLDVGRSLRLAGKKVVLSGMTLLESASDLRRLERLCKEDDFDIEANDFAAIELLHAQGREFITGPAINIYNQHSLSLLASQGMKRWTLSVELGRAELTSLQTTRPEGVETEIFVWGKMPLAYSARCFTARAHKLPKDDCQLRCLADPSGLLMSTREDESFLTINGVQTQSALTCNLMEYTHEMSALDVDVWRISPQPKHTLDIIAAFDRCRGAVATDTATLQSAHAWAEQGACDGYWNGVEGMQKTEIELMENRV